MGRQNRSKNGPKQRHLKTASTLKKEPFFEQPIPHYTSSLDAIVPGEHIVYVRWDDRINKWISINQPLPSLAFYGVGNTEVLSRRIAGLKALAWRENGNQASSEQHNQDFYIATLNNLVEAMTRLFRAANESNELGEGNHLIRVQTLSEIQGALGVVEAIRENAGVVAIALLPPLLYISTKFVDAVMGKLAEQALSYLEILLGWR